MNRQPITLTAEDAATRAYNWVAAKPEHANSTPAQIRPAARQLLSRLIGSGLFVIAN